MQSDQQFYLKNAMPPLADQVDNNYMKIPVPSVFDGVFPPGAKNLGPFNRVEFQPSEVCPKNFIIFNQTEHQSQIMFNPRITHKFSGPIPDTPSTYRKENFGTNEGKYVEREVSSSFIEDSGDIDALLSLEGYGDEDEEECDEDEISTARMYWNNEAAMPESVSIFSSKTRKNGSSSSIQKPSDSSGSCNSDGKQQKMKKMVRALRGIVPGGEQMDTVTILDEAVKYLKSLKVEVQKLGITDLKY